jgi:hypothetical protein
VMASLGQHPTKEQLTDMIARVSFLALFYPPSSFSLIPFFLSVLVQVDTSGSGVLDFDDFLALVSPMRPDDENDLKVRRFRLDSLFFESGADRLLAD